MRWRFIDGGLPAPDLQVRVGDGSRHAVSRHRVARAAGRERSSTGVEAHMTPLSSCSEDRRRHNWLTDQDWTAAALHGRATSTGDRAAMIATTAAALGLHVPRYAGDHEVAVATRRSTDGVSPRRTS